MGLASVIHPGMPRLSPAPNWTRLQLAHHHIIGFRTVVHSRGAEYFPIACSRGTEQEDHLSTSDSKGISSQSYDDIIHTDSSNTPTSVSNLEKTQGHETYVSSVKTVALWVCTAVAFGIGLGLKDGVGKASEFFAGYILEQSLSVDNLFVFVLVFKYFKVPIMYQNRVLSYGIAGAVVFRLTLILLGTVTLQRFEAVNLLLAAILLYSSFKLFSGEEDDTDLSDNFVVKTCQRFIPVTSSYDGNRFITTQDGVWKATPLLLTVAVIELSDIVFAVDSIPAVFGVTRDPFIVFTSNLFAILGLRSLYTLISEGMSDLEYLQPSIGVVLGFIGSKMILDFFGFHISTEASLAFVAATLSTGVVLSLTSKSD
ncbi:thylakoid membrane protein TERC, chloroplastic [Alnus glutinosa]|uniref:thylakoid membrane protein TERC, chloroplastic n=1 Tax=Alnus glutinosa TaxID=3517 RepID=UPI002D767876|nr:thylakoid membrane protein TERC, chloroplastic [Alnus glutinosa]